VQHRITQNKRKRNKKKKTSYYEKEPHFIDLLAVGGDGGKTEAEAGAVLDDLVRRRLRRVAEGRLLRARATSAQREATKKNANTNGIPGIW
jgi:hypothetical protein